MNYEKIYNNIIENRKDNPLDEANYGEIHHILPRSLGGVDEPDNLVRLSAREHFICHALLAEMYEEGSNEWYKMNHAFMMMKCSTDKQPRYINSRLYELKRKDFSKVMSELQSGSNNSQYKKIWMYNLNTEDNIKVSEDYVQKYKMIGYVCGRIMNFDSFKEKLKKKTNRILKQKDNKDKKEQIKKKYYNDLYTNFIKSNYNTLSDYINNSNYPHSLPNLVINMIKYVDSYKIEQGNPKKENIRSRECIINGILYESVTDASRQLKIPYSTVRKRINSKNFNEWLYY